MDAVSGTNVTCQSAFSEVFSEVYNIAREDFQETAILVAIYSIPVIGVLFKGAEVFFVTQMITLEDLLRPEIMCDVLHMENEVNKLNLGRVFEIITTMSVEEIEQNMQNSVATKFTRMNEACNALFFIAVTVSTIFQFYLGWIELSAAIIAPIAALVFATICTILNEIRLVELQDEIRGVRPSQTS